jgi:hypothetical protein
MREDAPEKRNPPGTADGNISRFTRKRLSLPRKNRIRLFELLLDRRSLPLIPIVLDSCSMTSLRRGR